MPRSQLSEQRFGGQAHGLPGSIAFELSEERDIALRAARPWAPSQSRVQWRCAVCGQWPIIDAAGRCRGAGSLHDYDPLEPKGLTIVR